MTVRVDRNNLPFLSFPVSFPAGRKLYTLSSNSVMYNKQTTMWSNLHVHIYIQCTGAMHYMTLVDKPLSAEDMLYTYTIRIYFGLYAIYKSQYSVRDSLL